MLCLLDKKSRTSPYRPQGNGICKSFNGKLIHMLRTLLEKQRRNDRIICQCQLCNQIQPDAVLQVIHYFFYFCGRVLLLYIDSIIDCMLKVEDLIS